MHKPLNKLNTFLTGTLGFLMQERCHSGIQNGWGTKKTTSAVKYTIFNQKTHVGQRVPLDTSQVRPILYSTEADKKKTEQYKKA